MPGDRWYEDPVYTPPPPPDTGAWPAGSPPAAPPPQAPPPSSAPPAPSAAPPPPTSDQSFAQQAKAQFGSGIPDDIVNLLRASGIPLTSQGAQFYVDELDAGNGAAFQGFHLPGTDSQHDFFQLMSWAETWAGNEGWKHLPTPFLMQWATENGMLQAGQQAFNEWLFHMMPAADQQAMPWAWTGMSHEAYKQHVQSYQDVINQLVGEGSYSNQGLLDQAMREQWSTERLRTHLLQDQGFTNQFQYTKHGYDYHTWQQFKTSQRNAAVTRFGTNPGESEYLQMITNPLESFHASGGAVQQDQQAQQHLQSYTSAIR